MEKDNKEKATAIFENLKLLFENDTSLSEDNANALKKILVTAIERIAHNSQTVELEAQSVFQNIHTYAFVEKIHLTTEEANYLKKVESYLVQKGYGVV